MADPRVEWQALREFTTQVFEELGMPPPDAALEADVLVWANLHGIDSHGVQRVAEYSQRVADGGMNPRPEIRIVRETPAALLIEADHAFGPVVTVFAVEQVVTRARQMAVAWALIRNTTHQGAMGYYTELIARRGMAGIAVVCNPPNMAPTGARAPGVHNSPISIAVPGREWPSLNLDIATSVAAGGKVQVAVDKGVPIPDDWALDRDGQPTTDPRQAVSLRPAGGYKGYGLALMFECLSSMMVGNPLLIPSLLGKGVRPGTQNGFVVAVDIAFFTDLEEYQGNVDLLVRALKGLPLAAGADEVLMPGEREQRVRQERMRDGIPLPPGTVEKLRATAKRLGLAPPPGL